MTSLLVQMAVTRAIGPARVRVTLSSEAATSSKPALIFQHLMAPTASGLKASTRETTAVSRSLLPEM